MRDLIPKGYHFGRQHPNSTGGRSKVVFGTFISQLKKAGINKQSTCSNVEVHLFNEGTVDDLKASNNMWLWVTKLSNATGNTACDINVSNTSFFLEAGLAIMIQE